MSGNSRRQKRLYSVPEAAAYLGRSPDGVRELIWGGKLPAVRIDRRVFIDVEDMDRVIEASKETYDH